jgi:hypothetical protein
VTRLCKISGHSFLLRALNCSFIGFRCLASLALDVVVPWTGYKTSLALWAKGHLG